MPRDSHRLDLNADLENLAGDFLKDVEAATKEVKARKEADAAKDRRKAVRAKDRRTSLIVIAAATVVLILAAYWMVSAREPQQVPVAVVAPQRVNPPISTSRSAASVGQRPTAPRLTPPTSASTQRPQRPANEYDTEPM